MAAYSALVTLEQLLNQLLYSDQLPKEQVLSLHGMITSLKSSFEEIFPAPKRYRSEANKLADRIREKIFEALDTIESFIFFTQNHPPESPETSKNQSLTSISLEEIIAGIDPITEEAKKLASSVGAGKAYVPIPVVKSTKIVGQDMYRELIEEKLLAEASKRQVIPICGMPGIGKTTLAKSIYEDDNFMKKFPYKGWVTVSQDANVQDILGKLLHSLEGRGQKPGDKVYEGDEAQLQVELHQALSNNKYLVVVENMWDIDVWMKLKTALPDSENSSRILLTTRILKVADAVKSTEVVEMEPLNEEESWTLLRSRTFGDDIQCPENLVSVGRKIAKHCKGLPLSLTVIGGLLSQESRETEYWYTIEEDMLGSTSTAEVEDEYREIMSFSYDYLPCKLKECFLYMAAFPEDSDVHVSKLIRLWVAEGFLTIPPPRPHLQLIDKGAELSLVEAENSAKQALQDLIDRCLVVIRKTGSDGRVKACMIHSVFREIAVKECGREMFFHSRKKYKQDAVEGTNTQRRVIIHRNDLMCFDHVYNSTKLITKARSLLYIGPHYHHPMPYNLTFDLLRVLDAFTVFFIRFPNEILKLIHLRYLSFTYNGKLPSSLSRLHKLQVLIVKRQPVVIYVGTPFLPDEIWNMKELRHLIITETDLPRLSPTDPGGSILLENLQTLSNVNATSCAEEVLGNMPNLKKLVMWVEAPGKVGLYLNKLDQLEAFKFTVLEPIPGEKIECHPKLFFPDTLRKLCLCGTGLPWEDMEVIAKLPNLQVLKLKEVAFSGAEWCPTYVFEELKFLLIEYLDLKIWESDSSNFPCLEQIIIRHCYDLEVFPSYIVELSNLRVIEVVDCSIDAVAWAEDVKTDAEDFGIKMLKVRIHSSWE